MKSQFEIVKELLADDTVNWLKVDYFKRAKFEMAAWFRAKTGQTVETGGIKKSHFLSSRTCGSHSPSLLLTMSRETGSRNDDGAFDFRSMILAALCVKGGKEQNVTEILVNRNFTKGFEGITLSGLPIFPQFADDKAEKEWSELFLKLVTFRATKTLLDKQLTALKRKLDKKAIIEQEGCQFFFEEPTGTSDAIVDKDGNKIPQVSSLVPYLELELAEPPAVSVEKYGVGEIVKLYNKIKELAGKIGDLTSHLRPYELGIIERFDGDRKSIFKVGNLSVKISEGFSGGGSQHSEETMKKVESKEYTLVQLPKEKGKWVCNPIVKGTVEMEQLETVEV